MTQTSREFILKAIRKHTRSVAPKPDMGRMQPIVYEDKPAQFCSIVEMVGGKVQLIDDDVDLAGLIRGYYPEATRFLSNIEIEGLPCTHPRDAHSAGEMNGIDVTIVTSPLGVCENGCVWLEQLDEWRAQYFITENLVVLLDKKHLVNNMHEAYQAVQDFAPTSPYSGFISGPSKTADIEQALVIGAHGARGLLVLLK